MLTFCWIIWKKAGISFFVLKQYPYEIWLGVVHCASGVGYDE